MLHLNKIFLHDSAHSMGLVFFVLMVFFLFFFVCFFCFWRTTSLLFQKSTVPIVDNKTLRHRVKMTVWSTFYLRQLESIDLQTHITFHLGVTLWHRFKLSKLFQSVKCFGRHILMSFVGSLVPLFLDFWRHLLWVSKPEWVLSYSHRRGTSGATHCQPVDTQHCGVAI